MRGKLRTAAGIVFITVLLTAVSALGFTISGTVTDPLAAPVNNVDVFLYDQFGNPIGIPQTRTDNNGLYSILNISAGTYGVEFVPDVGTLLLPRLYTPIVVSGNTTVNGSLVQGNLVTGTVTDTLGNPIVDIDLNAYIQSSGNLFDTPGDNTNLLGQYQILLPDDVFRIRWRSTLPGQRWVPLEIEGVNITGDTTINVVMVSGYFLSGTVRNQSLVPVFDVDLDIVDPSTGVTLITPSDNTDALGNYSLLIPGGTFDIQVEPLTATKLVPKESLSVVVNADKMVNFTLQSGIILSGVVSVSGGAGLGGVDINVDRSSNNARMFTPFDNTDGAGAYGIVLPIGTYNLAYRPPVASGKAPILRLNVPVNKDTVVNVTVPSGIVLTATVTGPGGPVANVDVDAFLLPGGAEAYLFDDVSSATGTISVVVTPGQYRLNFNPPIAAKLVGKQFPNQNLSVNTNLPVSLQSGFILSGTVRDSANALYSGARVRAIDVSTGDTIYTPGDTSSAAGFYDVVVPADVYNLLYIPRPSSPTRDSVKLFNVSVAKDTTVNVKFATGGSPCKCGDADGNGSWSIADPVVLINYIFAGGPAPAQVCLGDADGNKALSIADAVFLINYIFAGGAMPAGC